MSDMPQRQLFTLQIITGALGLGVALFSAVVLVLGIAPILDEESAQRLAPLAYVGAALPILAFGATFGILAWGRNAAAQKLPQNVDPYNLTEALTHIAPPIVVSRVVAAAVAESAGLLAVIGYLLTADWIALIGVGVALIAVLRCVPSPRLFEQTLEAIQAQRGGPPPAS